MGSMVTFGAMSATSTLHASALRLSITMASEPQTPCAQDRRKLRVPSWCHFTSCRDLHESLQRVGVDELSHQLSSEHSGCTGDLQGQLHLVLYCAHSRWSEPCSTSAGVAISTSSPWG